MHPHERDVLPKIGPHFLLGSDGAVLFKFVVDVNNILGPRVASDADKATHPEAWARFERENPPESVKYDANASFVSGLRHHAHMAEDGCSFDGPLEPDPEKAAKLRAEAEAIEQPKRRGRPPKVA